MPVDTLGYSRATTEGIGGLTVLSMGAFFMLVYLFASASRQRRILGMVPVMASGSVQTVQWYCDSQGRMFAQYEGHWYLYKPSEISPQVKQSRTY